MRSVTSLPRPPRGRQLRKPHLLSAQVQTGIYLGLLLLTIRSHRVEVLLVRTLQRYTMNPLMRLLLAIGINPFGLPSPRHQP